MYVCICHAVTDREIRRCIEAGADSMRALRAELKVGTQCGKCAAHVRSMLDEPKGSTDAGFLNSGYPA